MIIETSLGKDGIRDDQIRQEEVVGFLAKGSACACAIEVTILMQHFCKVFALARAHRSVQLSPSCLCSSWRLISQERSWTL